MAKSKAVSAEASKADMDREKEITGPAPEELAFPASAASLTGRKPPRFEIRTPHGGFTGKRPGSGGKNIVFRDGVCETDDAAAAEHAARRCGYQVTDRETGDVINPLR